MLSGNWTITQNLFNAVTRLFPSKHYPRLLETGSGTGTKAWLEAGYVVTSVEHDAAWIKSGSQNDFVFAPLVGNYYDREVVGGVMSCQFFDIWLLDGPPGHIADRAEICSLMEELTFITPRVVIVDDSEREDGRKVSECFSTRYPHAPRLLIANTGPHDFRHDATIFILE